VIPVVVAEVVRKDMPVTLRAIGRSTVEATVVIKPQVTGMLTGLHFAEGQDVQAGDLLATMDARPFEVALARARADLAQAASGAKNAGDQAQRYTDLHRTGGASREQYEQFVTVAQQAGAEEESAKAAVQKAQLDLDYCTMRAPMTGRVGRRLIAPGNVVIANQSEVVVINQLAPMDVTFTLPERYLAVLQSRMAAGGLRVVATMEGVEPRTVVGEVDFLDNAVQVASGTIELKARFANEAGELWPGQFVTVVVDLAVEKDVVVVPTSAPQTGPAGAFVFVVRADQTVEVQKVTVARSTGAEAVVSAGLEGGERVVVDGQSRLVNGSKVEVKESVEAAAAAAAATVLKPRL
jgi:multidrug efflux system membrane fusion protein